MRAFQLILSPALILFLQAAGDAPAPSVYPPVKPGLWELKATRVLANGEIQSWTLKMRACRDATSLFAQYWGVGVIEKRGCVFRSTKTAPRGYLIVAECAVRGVARATSEATVTVTGDYVFELSADIREGARRYSAREKARRKGDC